MCLVSCPRITTKLFLLIYVLQGGKKLVHVSSACQLELWRNRVTALDLLALLCFCTVSELLRYKAMASKLDAPISNMDPMEDGDTHFAKWYSSFELICFDRSTPVLGGSFSLMTGRRPSLTKLSTLLLILGLVLLQVALSFAGNASSVAL